MDLLSPRAMLKRLSLGVAFGPDSLHLSLLSSHWDRVRRVDAETIEDFQAMPPDQRRARVHAFLQRNRADHCSVVVTLPRREVLLRQLDLPLEARENLTKVVDYQLVNLLPSEEQAVATDTLTVREESSPPRLRVTLFVVLRSTLERTLASCRELSLSPDRILPSAVALADYLRVQAPGTTSAPSLVIRLDPDRGELAALVEGQLRLCKEFRYDPSNLEEVLESEVELFRGEAGLGEEVPMQLFLAGDSDALGGAEERLPVRTLSPPRPAGSPRPPSRPSSADWPALAAAFCGFRRKDALEVNLLPAEQRPRKSRWEKAPTFALAAVNALLLLGLLLQGPVQQRAFSERMSRERERLEPAVSAFRELEAERNLWRERVGLLEGHRNRNAHLLAALADLSLILPVDSMVRLFNLEDGVVRIQGTSGQAAALPRILEDSRYFREVELVSGITRDSRGRESYNIQARLEDPLPLSGGPGLPTQPNPASRLPLPLTDNPAQPAAQPAPASEGAPREVAP
ncbi:MAG: PilN domain-containing protein [Acidobacteriota bacterium]|nr:PilN domain-containing protein [Acidobacteriota bacterium]MDE2963930.1 PilN domain-containing protein [Acidobacteriota bacterium]